jgi:hypothetical protein
MTKRCATPTGSTAIPVSTYFGQIPVRRQISAWHLDICTGYIYGNYRPFEFDFELFEKGRVLGFTENVVIARSRNRIYAFVLNGLDPSYANQKKQYLAYLQSKQLQPEIIF